MAAGAYRQIGSEGLGALPESDRCPYPRPFGADFSACPTYHAVTFMAADSMHRQLGSKLTCRHLASGNVAEVPGRFYARCALGPPSERLKWLALVSPERLEKARALQQEFDLFSWPQREKLFAAKANVLAAPDPAESRQRLERLLTGFLDEIQTFLAERRERFEEVGLPPEPLMQLIEDWSWAWVKSREVGNARLNEDRLQAFSRETHAFLAPAPAAPSWPDDAPFASRARGSQPIFADGILRISRDSEPPGLSLDGEIDASNVDAVARAVAVALVGSGDVVLDLSGVVFCDLGGIRTIVGVAQSLGGERRLVLRLPAQLQRAMQIVGWAELPGLVIAGSGVSGR